MEEEGKVGIDWRKIFRINFELYFINLNLFAFYLIFKYFLNTTLAERPFQNSLFNLKKYF
jgi:hypothetical protein